MKNIATFLVIGFALFACNICKFSDRGNENSNSGTSTNSTNLTSNTTTGANTKRFVNSKASLSGSLAENYADFSFSYPTSWKLDAEAGKPGASNFVKAEKMTPDGYTMENFAVGTFTSSGSATGDQLLFPQLANQFSSQFAGSFPNYEKVSEGSTRVGSYEGYEFRFAAMLKDTPKGDMPIWGRVVMIPNATGKKNGVTLVMIATPLAAGIQNLNDVGVKGETPMILNSFRLD